MSALVEWMRSHPGLLARTASEHLLLSGAALGLIVAVALPLGIVLARHPRAAAPALWVVNALRTVPSLALLALMLPLLGTGFPPSMVALTLYALPTVLLNTLAGLSGVRAEIVDAARGQGLSERQILARVELPLAAPVILSGVRSAGVQVVAAATLAVFIGGGGLGELISAGMALLDMPQLIVGAGSVAALAVATELGLRAVERAVASRTGAEGA